MCVSSWPLQPISQLFRCGIRGGGPTLMRPSGESVPGATSRLMRLTRATSPQNSSLQPASLSLRTSMMPVFTPACRLAALK